MPKRGGDVARLEQWPPGFADPRAQQHVVPEPRRREQILYAARSVETQPSMIGFSPHMIAAAIKP